MVSAGAGVTSKAPSGHVCLVVIAVDWNNYMWPLPGLPHSMRTPFQIKHIKRATSFDLALEVAIHHLLQSQALPDSGGETTSPHLNERGSEITLYKVHVR